MEKVENTYYRLAINYQMQYLFSGIVTVNQALEIVGGLSQPGKMPCHGYSISAKDCNTGSIMRDVPGSSCSGCYAMDNFYTMPYVEEALNKRLKSLQHPQWVESMVFLINHLQERFFRWHDSGDLQNMEHLFKIINVVQDTPYTKHWLPTLEWNLIRKFWELMHRRKLDMMFPNLSIRLSGLMIDGELPIELAKMMGVQVSGVSKHAWDCPAYEHTYIVKNGRHNEALGNCGDCRNCWDTNRLLVVYPYH